MNWLTIVGLAAVVIPSLYIYTVSIVATRFPVLRNKRICLLIAHPDDEAMFFAPTVLALTRPETGNHVKILCLSSGMSRVSFFLSPALGLDLRQFVRRIQPFSLAQTIATRRIQLNPALSIHPNSTPPATLPLPHKC